jgi:hypothetical protein
VDGSRWRFPCLTWWGTGSEIKSMVCPGMGFVHHSRHDIRQIAYSKSLYSPKSPFVYAFFFCSGEVAGVLC